MCGRITTPKLEKRKPVTLAYIEHVGPYGKIPFDSLIPRLYAWVKDKKAMPGFYPMGIFHSNPNTTPPERCRTDLAITVSGNPKPEGGVKIRKLPAMTVATLSHKGPGSEYQRSYGILEAFVEEKGYVVCGSPMEIYSRRPEVVDGRTVIYAKIMFPVKKR